ncbi:MAG: FAD-dependent oxidoreductase [Rhodovibrionaceae bacterium]
MILVVGAGPTGLTAALELTRRGRRVRIIDKAAERSRHSKAIGINPRTLELLEACGASGRILAEGRRMNRLAIHTSQRCLLRVDFTKLDHRYNRMTALQQSRTEALLEDLLAAQGVAVERGCEALGVEQDDSAARVQVRRGEIEEEIAAEQVVAADGAHSALRKSLGIGFPGERYPGDWQLADVAIADWRYPQDQLNIFFQPRDLLLVIGLEKEGLYRLACNAGGPIPRLQKLGIAIDEVVWSSRFRIGHHLIDRFSQGRVHFAGDAAHLHSPAGGRGLNLGVEDACVLAMKLCEGGLEDYSEERRKIAMGVIRMTGGLTRVATLSNPLAQGLRNLLLEKLLSREFLQRRLRRSIAGIAYPNPVTG